MSRKIIGLLGGKGSGKSTVCNYLVQKYGAVKYAFADPLKEIARRVFDFSEEQLYGSQETKETVDPRYGFSPRWLLQKLGTEGIREVLGQDIWWETCLARILNDGPELAVIEDFRFHSEVDGFLGINDMLYDGESGETPVMIWRIERADDAPPMPNENDQHQSEQEWATARHTHLLKPVVHGIPALYSAIDRLTFDCGLDRKVLVLP